MKKLIYVLFIIFHLSFLNANEIDFIKFCNDFNKLSNKCNLKENVNLDEKLNIFVNTKYKEKELPKIENLIDNYLVVLFNNIKENNDKKIISDLNFYLKIYEQYPNNILYNIVKLTMINRTIKILNHYEIEIQHNIKPKLILNNEFDYLMKVINETIDTDDKNKSISKNIDLNLFISNFKQNYNYIYQELFINNNEKKLIEEFKFSNIDVLKIEFYNMLVQNFDFDFAKIKLTKLIVKKLTDNGLSGFISLNNEIISMNKSLKKIIEKKD